MTTDVEPPLDLVAALVQCSSLGYRISAEARDWPTVASRVFDLVARHPIRPLLLLDAAGAIIDASTQQRLAPSTADTLERLHVVDARLREGFGLTGDAALAPALARLFGLARPAADVGCSPWSRSADATLEIFGDRLYACHRSPARVADALSHAASAGARLRLVDDLALPVAAIDGDGADPIAQLGDLCITRIGTEGFLQERRLHGAVVDRRLVEGGRARVAAVETSARLRSCFAEARLVRCSEWRSEVSPHLATAARAGWAHYDAWAEQLASIVAIDEWGGRRGDGFNPVLSAMPVGRDGFLASEAGLLLPVTRIPFRGHKIYTARDGMLFIAAWHDAGPREATAMTPGTLLEKLALWQHHPRRPRAGGMATMTVDARAGKRFWRGLHLDADAAASDDTFETFVSDDVWVERGRCMDGSTARVEIWAAPASERHALAVRLSKASGGAPIVLNLEVPGMYALAQRLRTDGVAVA